MATTHGNNALMALAWRAERKKKTAPPAGTFPLETLEEVVPP